MTPTEAQALPADRGNGLRDLMDSGADRRFKRGATLIRQGDASDRMYVILSGSVHVVREHPDALEPVLLAVLGPGELVGEMGILDGGMRSATVTAAQETVAVEIEADVVAARIAEDPSLYHTLASVLSRRLRSADDLSARMAVEPRQ